MTPIAYSILSADALNGTIARAYGIDATRCLLVRRGLHDTYEVTAPRSRYVARVYRAGMRAVDEIAYELDLVAHLASRGVAVAAPVPTREGSLIVSLQAPEGLRHLVLFSGPAGSALSCGNVEHCAVAGRLLAAIHSASDDFQSPHPRAPLDLAALIDQPLAAVRPFLTASQSVSIERFADDVRQRLGTVSPALDWGPCHGDFTAAHIETGVDRTASVADFGSCGPGWRAFDLAADSWADPVHNADGRFSFIKGYLDVRTLADADREAIPLFRAMRLMSTLGVYASNVECWGTQHMRTEKLDGWMTCFQEWRATLSERTV